MTTTAERENRRDALLDYAKAHPRGFTIYDAMLALEATRTQVKRSLQDLRRSLEGDSINIAWDPLTSRYALVGSYEAAASYRHFRLADVQSWATTDLATARSFLLATPADHPDHAAALMVESTMGHLLTLIRALNR